MEPVELVVISTKPPSYIKTLTDCCDDIILVHKLETIALEDLYISAGSERDKTHNESLDITGSPLKVDLSSSFPVDLCDALRANFWKKEEEKHHPLPQYRAKLFIEDYWRKNFANAENKPVWVICESTDEKKIVLLSAFQSPERISRSSVTVSKYFSEHDPFISFEAMCERIFETVADLTGSKQRVPLRQITSKICSIYEVSALRTSDNLNESFQMKRNVTLEVSWDTCCPEIPLDGSKSTMTIQTTVGQNSFLSEKFWEELLFLELYIKTLNEYRSASMANNFWLPTRIKSRNETELINEIIEVVRNCNKASKCGPKISDFDLQKVVENVGERNYDITDQLWMILNQCSNYGELLNCLDAAFQEIAYVETDVYIADSNVTCMAQIIRELKAGKLAVPRLTETQPIELVIDIGLEKLRKDFVHIFVQAKIATVQELNELFINRCGNEDGSMFENSAKTDFARNKMRTTLYYKKSMISAENIDCRMKLLGQWYMALETVLLVPEKLLLSAKNIYEYYVGSESPIQCYSTLVNNKTYEICVDLPVTETYEYVKAAFRIWHNSLFFRHPSTDQTC